MRQAMRIDLLINSPIINAPISVPMHTGWLAALADHLWQSTLFVAFAWLLTLALRRNQARLRYWIWLAASLKFLVPLSLLVAVGHRIGESPVAPVARKALAGMAVSSTVEQITQPFLRVESFAETPAAIHHSVSLVLILAAVWVCGALVLLLNWARAWRRLHATASAASLLPLASGVPVLSSSSLMEPGVFGIIHPVLMLPEGILDRLEEAQLQAVIAHELCHIRRRDNLTFAMHMAVETLFWFHPLMWWLRARLIEERERACDEAVLQSGNSAEVYAEGILNVCKFYVESPLVCAAGVTGSDLKQRIVRIMTLSVVQKLGPGRRLLLAGAAALVLFVPLSFGLLHSVGVHAQGDAAAAKPEFEVATIKPDKGGDDQRSLMMSTGKFSMHGMPVAELIRFAYDLKSDAQLTGGPNWVNSDKFDIEAKESDAQVQAFAKNPGEPMVAQVRLMVQSLLADRFHLKISHDTKELPVYVLVVAKNGPKMTATEAPLPTLPDDRGPGGPPKKKSNMSGIRMHGRGDLEGMSTTTDLLANVLSRQEELGNRLVLDKTGLTDHYNWQLKWTPSDAVASTGAGGAGPSAPAEDPSAPSLFTALQEQLGLKLEPQKAPVGVIVIDSIEAPTPN